MSGELVYAVSAIALAVGVFAGWLTIRNKPVSNALFYGMALVEVLLVVQLVVGCVALAQTSRDVDGVTFVSYLITVVLIPPAALLWGIADKSRWGTGVVTVGMWTVAALGLRILDLWTGRYA